MKNTLQLFIILCLILTITSIKNLRLGFIFVHSDTENGDLIGFDMSGGIVPVVLDRIKKEELLINYNFTVFYDFDNCTSSKSIGKTYEMIAKKKADVIFGPTCNEGALKAAFLANYYNKPIFVWGLTYSDSIVDFDQLNNLYTPQPRILSLAMTAIDVIQLFNWSSLSFLYAPRSHKKCSKLYEEFTEAINVINLQNVEIYSLQTSTPPLGSEYDRFIDETKIRSRIIISCFDRIRWKRDFLLKMYDRGLNNFEYVHLNLEYEGKGFYSYSYDINNEPKPLYVDSKEKNDGRDGDAFEMAKKMLILDREKEYALTKEIINEAIQRIKEWPFFCKTCNITRKQSLNRYAGYLGDSVYSWAVMLNKSLKIYGNDIFNNPSEYRNQCKQIKYGYTGHMSFNNDCIRLPYIFLNGLDKNGKQRIWLNYTFINRSHYNRIENVPSNLFKSTIFENWDNNIPLNEPICGYLNNKCPKQFFKAHFTKLIATFSTIFLIGIIIIIIIIRYIHKLKIKREEENKKWKIDPISLKELSKNINRNTNNSYIDTKTASNVCLKKLDQINKKNKYIFLFFNNEIVVGKKHKFKVILSDEDSIELLKIYHMDHENINKFIGMSYNENLSVSFWRFCKKGSLHDFLQNDIPYFDTFFMISFAKDICNGLNYLHSSYIQFHGTLTSKVCFVNDRWQIKISNFDLKRLFKNDEISKKELLWRSPECLRNDNFIGSKESDIYSYGIILSEIISKGNFWNLKTRKESIEELIYLIKKQTFNKIRPDIVIPLELETEIDTNFINLVESCWDEDPSRRPTTKEIEKVLRNLNDGDTKNLMDHIFLILEEHAKRLNDEIDKRTEEIVQEKKKCDILLQKMLPSEVANKLKFGKIIEPETFENVTILFADIVKFTNIQLKCSPFEIVTLVNELFSLFDNLIESKDVYKVETIGDGYLCVSGLPTRNGDMHSKEIADLALGLLDISNRFTIQHLNNEKINLRIGCNSGPCVAGVVGLSMPRYCLFGDTVNTASRMESNSKSGKIHITESCSSLLKSFGCYIIESRGEVIIKGKGIMNTYWLIGKT